MLTIRAMSDGKGYSSRHLEHSDYYAEGERVVGHWQGRGAELLRSRGEVKSEDFEALRQGLDPEDRRVPSATAKRRSRRLRWNHTVPWTQSLRLHHLGAEIRFDHGCCRRRQTAHRRAQEGRRRSPEGIGGLRRRRAYVKTARTPTAAPAISPLPSTITTPAASSIRNFTLMPWPPT